MKEVFFFLMWLITTILALLSGKSETANTFGIVSQMWFIGWMLYIEIKKKNGI